MKSVISWKESMLFEAVADDHTVAMDAKRPIGKGSAPTPKDLVAMGLAGCTAMDVIALLKKYKQPPQTFAVEVEITPSEGQQPAVFAKANLSYVVEGNVEADKLMEAVHLSQTKYCGVSAMLSKALPIFFRVVLNGVGIGSGQAEFKS